jgi:hypothetical protein
MKQPVLGLSRESEAKKRRQKMDPAIQKCASKPERPVFDNSIRD